MTAILIFVVVMAWLWIEKPKTIIPSLAILGWLVTITYMIGSKIIGSLL